MLHGLLFAAISLTYSGNCIVIDWNDNNRVGQPNGELSFLR